jgi:thiamine kinase-like enzyme
MAELSAVQDLLGRLLGPAEAPPEVLGGGITNRNFRVRFGGHDYVARLSGKNTSVLGIDRLAEVAATRAAHALGVAPDVALYLPEHQCLVTQFVAARPAAAEELRREPLLGQVARALRAFHAGRPLPATFDAFRLGEVYRDETLARGGRVPLTDAGREVLALADRIEAALTHPEHEPVPCHNDMLTANFLVRPDGAVAIVDWEYAGNGDRYFDLANLSVNNGFGDDDDRRLLEEYWLGGGRDDMERRFAALRLMRIISDYREATWGVVQGVLSELDFDYAGYADEHFRRLLEAASDPRLERWLDAASS